MLTTNMMRLNSDRAQCLEKLAGFIPYGFAL